MTLEVSTVSWRNCCLLNIVVTRGRLDFALADRIKTYFIIADATNQDKTNHIYSLKPRRRRKEEDIYTQLLGYQFNQCVLSLINQSINQSVSESVPPSSICSKLIRFRMSDRPSSHPPPFIPNPTRATEKGCLSKTYNPMKLPQKPVQKSMF